MEGASGNDCEMAGMEEPLNLSASQLVQIMNCAMKRGHGDIPVSHVATKRRCVNSINRNATAGMQSCSSPSLLSGKSRQELIQRNKYLERRVRELEQAMERVEELEILERRVEELERLNALLQYGLVRSVRGAIVETLKSIIPAPDPIQDSRTAASTDTYGSYEGPGTHENINEEVFPSNGVVASSSDIVGDCGLKSQNIAWRGQQEFVKIKQDPEKHATEPPSSKVKLLGMANEIQQAVSESTNYKKLTNRLLNILFEREELACSTLTGKSKGEHAKEKLDEDTVNLIIQQAVMRFPGTSPSDVRVVISQNCKDKALRFHKSNRQPPNSLVLFTPADLQGIVLSNSGVDGIGSSPVRTLQTSAGDVHQSVAADATGHHSVLM